MIKLVKFLIGLLALAAAAYFVFMVPLGKDKTTLFHHLVSISRTDEFKKLEDDIGNTAKSAKTAISKEIRNQVSKDDSDTTQAGSKQEPEHTRQEKREIKNLIGSKRAPEVQDKDGLSDLIKRKNTKND